MKASHILVCVFALSLAGRGFSQTADHSQHQENESKAENSSKPIDNTPCTPEHAAMGHCKLEKKKAVQVFDPKKSEKTNTDSSCTPEHAAMGHCKPIASPSPKSGKHQMNGGTEQSDKAVKLDDPDCPPEHAALGHCTPKNPANESKANGTATGTDLPAGNAPAPEAPEVSYADKVWGKEAMAPVRANMYNEHGGMISSMLLLDLAAARLRDGEDGYQWDSEAWLGNDLNRIFIKSEGESYSNEGVESAEVQALYSRPIGPYFDIQAGVRHDFRPEPSKTYFALGFEGLSPYWNEIEGTLFISEKGDLLGRFKGRYDQLITQRFVLESLAEFNFSAQEEKDNGTGSGLVDAEISLRLRYEIKREVAPYLGISWKSKFGDTAQFARDSGESKDHSSLLAGVRIWM